MRGAAGNGRYVCVVLMLLVGGVVTAHPAHILLPFQLEYNIKLASGEDITGGEVEVTSLEQDQLMQFPPAPYSQLASPDLASFPQPHLYKLTPSKRNYLGIELPDFIAQTNHGKLREQMEASGK